MLHTRKLFVFTFTFTFTFSHLADAFVQSDVQGSLQVSGGSICSGHVELGSGPDITMGHLDRETGKQVWARFGHPVTELFALKQNALYLTF